MYCTNINVLYIAITNVVGKNYCLIIHSSYINKSLY